MRCLYIALMLLFCNAILLAQRFDCDGSAYLVVYTQSVGETVLYKVDERLQYKKITLSEKRRLTGLAYNVSDGLLYAIDTDKYELVRISSDGNVHSLGAVQNLSKDYVFFSGDIGADGLSYYTVGHNPTTKVDERFYSINLNRPVLNAGYLGVTGDRPTRILDMSVDPINGNIYGYDNLDGRLSFMSIGGSIASGNFASTGQSNIDGLFFFRSGELIGFSPSGAFYSIDKRTGRLSYASVGPSGTSGDACSCPFTYSFSKNVEPRDIIPCEEFTVQYSFTNRMGIGQTWITFTDTFPEGFEIIQVKSKIISPDNIVPSPSNIVVLKNLIYVLGENVIELTVKAPPSASGFFGSRARHFPFPKIFGDISHSDDPTTPLPYDETLARIVDKEEIDFYEYLEYNCEGDVVFISSPITADTYNWSNGSTTKDITTDQLGWIRLTAEGECVYFEDSIYIDLFKSPKSISISGDALVVAGTPMRLTATINRGEIEQYTWYTEAGEQTCANCSEIVISPTEDIVIRLVVTDDQGCVLVATHQIRVDPSTNLYAPSIFSPNNDGINDFFNLSTNKVGICRSLIVYNRWGMILYEGKNIVLGQLDHGWDGRRNQLLMPSDVYIWLAEIEYTDGTTEFARGSITLMND